MDSLSTSNNIGIIVHFGGKIIHNAYGVTYNRPAIGARRIPRKTDLSGLQRLLSEMIETDKNQYRLKILAKYCDNNTSQLVSINSDRDLWFFFDPEAGNRSVNLFVHAEKLHTNVVPDIPTDYRQYAPSDSKPSESGSDESESESECDDDEVGGVSDKRCDDGNSSHQQVPVRNSRIHSSTQTLCIPNKVFTYDSDEGVLKQGMVFKDKKHLQTAVKDYSVRVVKREYRVVESTPNIWKIICKHGPASILSSSASSQQCNWWLRAGFVKRLSSWKITKYGSPHSCLMNGMYEDHRNLCTNMIADDLIGMVRCDPTHDTKYVQQHVKENYGYKISYHKAWHCLKRARDKSHGSRDREESSLSTTSDRPIFNLLNSTNDDDQDTVAVTQNSRGSGETT